MAKTGVEKPNLPDSQICHFSSLEANTDQVIDKLSYQSECIVPTVLSYWNKYFNMNLNVIHSKKCISYCDYGCNTLKRSLQPQGILLRGLENFLVLFSKE